MSAADAGTKQKKKKRPRPTAGRDEAAPADGLVVAPPDERPAFARSFPRDPELDRLVEVFEAGNYAEVRVRASALVHATSSDKVRRAARELLRRLDPDPIATYMLLVAIALLGFLSFWYWTHPHGAP